MQAIILAGGFGTRLKTLASDLPKPMAPINNKPFLAYLLDYLAKQNFKHIILSLYYLSHVIENYFQHHYSGLNISYVVEPKPLGTGGGIRYALEAVNQEEPVWVLNGDTFLKLNYHAMLQQSQQNKLSIAVRKNASADRYGSILTQDDCVIGFKEKCAHEEGLINAGVYLLNPNLFDEFDMPQVFSFEHDFLAKYAALLKPRFYLERGYFVDIGIPSDYLCAQSDLPQAIINCSAGAYARSV